MTGANTSKAAADLFTQAVDNFDNALKTGVKLQEDSLKWWSELATDSTDRSDWQKRAQSVFEEVIPTARKNAEESLKTFDQISKGSLEFLKTAFNSTPADTGPELQQRIQKLWEETLTALRKNTEAVLDTHARAMNQWTTTFQKGAPQGARPTVAPKS